MYYVLRTKKNKTLKNTGKMEKILEKSGNFVRRSGNHVLVLRLLVAMNSLNRQYEPFLFLKAHSYCQLRCQIYPSVFTKGLLFGSFSIMGYQLAKILE